MFLHRNLRSGMVIILVLLIGACTIYQPYDKEKAFKFIIDDSSQVVLGLDKWQGPEDCSADVYLNTLGNGLLITVEVNDDSVRTGNEASYQNDGIELYVDLRPERLRNRNIYEKGVFQAVIIPQPGKRNVAPIAWFPEYYNSQVPGATAFTQLLSTGYIVQVFFPYSGLKVNHYWPRKNFTIDIGINDSDVLNRETQLMWKGRYDNWASPSNFEPISLPDKGNQKPNLLLILTNQQTMMAMSAYGNPYIRTPNMDALSEWGIRFTQSYCTSPAAAPSRSSIITGLMPHQTGVLYNGMTPDSSIRNMGQLFHSAGYRTIWAGAWLLPEEFPGCRKISSVPGFEILNYLSPEKITGRGEDMDAPLTEAIVKVIKRKMDKPFLLVTSYQNPQDINEVAIRPDAYPPPTNLLSAPPLPKNHAISKNEPSFVSFCRKDSSNLPELFGTNQFNSAQWHTYLYHYYRMTERVDKEIGKLITTLENKGIDENTIIIMTSVLGDGAGSHKWAGGNSAYEEVVKTPFILCRFGNNLRNIKDEKHLISSLDILPTLLDYAGVEIPGNIEGLSLKSLTDNPDTAWRKFLVTEIAPDPENPSKSIRMIRWKNYKYINYSYGIRKEELFDLSNDPGEMNNLIYNPQFNYIKSEMVSMLDQWMEKTNDR